MITKEKVEEIQLFSEEAIHKHRQNNYKVLHIGLVQVAIKPLFRLGQNIPILVMLRDARNLNFNNSLLAVLNSNLESGPVYFDCYPNFTVGLHDPTILSALTINLKASNLTYQDKAQPVALIYRIYYKVMNTTISPRAIRMSPPGHTVIMEADKTKHKTFTPKRLAWDEIIKQTDWKVEKLCPPKPLHDQNESEIQQIIQEPDGTIRLKFRETPLEQNQPIITNKNHHNPRIEEIVTPRPSSATSTSKLVGVNYSPPIPKPAYENTSSPPS